MAKVIDEDSAAVMSHLEIMQGVIQRMATNSSSCKAWCITLVSAILVIVANKGKPNSVWVALIPTVLFWGLDAYYLALEKRFRKNYNEFIYKLHNGGIEAEDLYAVKPLDGAFTTYLVSFFSPSVLFFYFTIGLMIVLARFFLL